MEINHHHLVMQVIVNLEQEDQQQVVDLEVHSNNLRIKVPQGSRILNIKILIFLRIW